MLSVRHTADQDNIGAGVRDGQRHLASQPAAAAGDEEPFTRESEAIEDAHGDQFNVARPKRKGKSSNRATASRLTPALRLSPHPPLGYTGRTMQTRSPNTNRSEAIGAKSMPERFTLESVTPARRMK